MTLIKKYWIAIVVVFGLLALIKPALCLLILGSLFLYITISSITFLKNIKRKGITCTGSILEFRLDDDGNKMPLIQFTTLTGETITEQPFVYTSTHFNIPGSNKNMIGQSISILYDPEDPKKFVITSQKEFNYLILIVFILTGLSLIALTICSFLGYIDLG